MPWPNLHLQPKGSFRGRVLSLPTLVSFAIAGAFLLFLFTRFNIDLSSTWSSLKSSDPLLFLLAFAVHYTTFIFRGARWRLLIENARRETSEPTPGTLQCGSLILLGMFINSVMWFRLGEAYRAYAYTEDTDASFSGTIGTVAAEKVLDVALVFLLVAVASLFLAAKGVGTSWLFVGSAAGLVAALVVVVLLMWLFRARLAGFLPRPLEQAYHRFHEGTVGSFKRLDRVTALGLLGWLAEVARLFLVAHALGFSLGVPLVIFAALANAMLTLVFITPGGLGAVEWGVTSLLLLSSKIEIEEDALAIVALDRSISWLSVIAVGAAVFAGREVVKRRRKRAALTERGLHGGD